MCIHFSSLHDFFPCIGILPNGNDAEIEAICHSLWTYDQVQILRRYGHRWQGRHLACSMAQPETKAQQKIPGRLKASTKQVFLPSCCRIGHNCMKELEFPNISVHW